MWLLNNPELQLEKLKRFQEVVETEKIKKSRAFKKGKDYLDTIKVPQKKTRKETVNNDVSVKSIEKKQRLAKSQYSDYINSIEWKTKKKLYFKKHKKECSACGSTLIIHLHHMSYSQLGFEPDEHLVPLCNKCHDGLHRLFGTSENMMYETKQFIKAKKTGGISKLIKMANRKKNKRKIKKIRSKKTNRHK